VSYPGGHFDVWVPDSVNYLATSLEIFLMAVFGVFWCAVGHTVDATTNRVNNEAG